MNSLQNNKFAEILDFLIKQRNLNQTEVAKLSGLNQKTISNYLNKKSAPDLNKLVVLADFFNVSLDYLAKRETTTFDFSGYNQAQLSVARKIVKLNPVNLNRVDAMLDGLILGQTM